MKVKKHKSIRRRMNPNWQYIPRLYEISDNDLNTMAFSTCKPNEYLGRHAYRVCVYSLQKVNVPWCLWLLSEGWQNLHYKRQSQHGWNKMFPWSEVNFLLMLVSSRPENLIKSVLHTRSVPCKCTVISQGHVLTSWAKHDISAII